MGEVMAFKLTRAPRREFDTRVELWYAPSMNYLPVRIRVTQANGDFIDQKDACHRAGRRPEVTFCRAETRTHGKSVADLAQIALSTLKLAQSLQYDRQP